MENIEAASTPNFTDDLAYNVLHATFSSLLTIEAMDQIRGCEFYRKKLKTNGESFLSSLESFTNKVVPDIWGVQDETLYNIMEFYKHLAQKLARIEPAFMGVVVEMLNRLIEKPEETAKLLGITMVEKTILDHG